MKNTKGMTLIEVIISLLIISTASLIIVVGFVTALNLFTDSNHYKDVTNKQQKALVDEENKDTDIDVNDTLANYSITITEGSKPIVVNGTYKKATSKTYKDVNLTTDVIVGFPGETDEEFSKTYKFLKEIKFYKMHIFKYSPRKGTKAAVMPNQISGDIKEKRSRKLIELSDKNEIEYNESYIGKNVEVLFEEEKDGIFKGHTQNYIMVYCELNKNLENQVISVRCEKAEQEHILGNFIVQQ